jgi:hypothetical protein
MSIWHIVVVLSAGGFPLARPQMIALNMASGPTQPLESVTSDPTLLDQKRNLARLFEPRGALRSRRSSSLG